MRRRDGKAVLFHHVADHPENEQQWDAEDGIVDGERADHAEQQGRRHRHGARRVQHLLR
jgi:hypothetical protein